MSKKQKSGLYLILGVAAGVAAGLYLNSKNGRKMRSRALDGIREVSDEVSTRMSDLDGGLSTYRREAIEKVNNVRTQLADVMSPTEN